MKRNLLIITFFIAISTSVLAQATYYIATDGNDSNDGSNSSPWASVRHGLDNITDGDIILVKPGTYNDRIRIRGSFANGVLVKSEIPYMAKFRNNSPVVTAYTSTRGCHGITLEGFDIAHEGPGASPLVVHIDGNADGSVHDITIQDCILHDSYNNDLAKINNGCYNITIQRNLFFNHSGLDEHIDGNSVENLIIQDNIFMSDYAGSGRVNDNSTSSYIVIKDSGGNNDIYLGSRNVKIRRNVFLNWEGYIGSNYILLGEDGEPYYEVFDVTIENNLMLGNSSNIMRAPLGLKGVKDVTFRNNTIVGDLPANAFAVRSNREQLNPVNNNINFYNNIWSDPTGTMQDFSDSPLGHTDQFTIDNNLYWNNGSAIPTSSSDEINFSDDTNSIQSDPILADQTNILLPHYNSTTNQFGDGSTTIREAFLKLVNTYGTPANGSPVIDSANASNASNEDILGNSRSIPDIGAVEYDGSLSLLPKSHENEVIIYPIPTSSKINLTLGKNITGNVEFVLYSIEGRVVNTQTLYKSSKKTTINWNILSFQAGIYILKIKNNNHIYSRKIIVK